MKFGRNSLHPVPQLFQHPGDDRTERLYRHGRIPVILRTAGDQLKITRYPQTMPEHDLPDLIRLIEADDGAVRRIPFQQFRQLFPAGIRSGKQFLLRRNSRFFECGEITVAGTRHRSIDEQDVPAAPFQQTVF